MLQRVCRKQVARNSVAKEIARFNALAKTGKESTTYDYHEILYSAAKNRDPTIVKFWYELLKKDNKQPNIETFGIVLGSCCIEGFTARGLFFLHELTRYYETVPVKFLETMSFMLTQDGSTKEAKVFDDLAKTGKPASSKAVQDAISTAQQNKKYSFE